jgi:hypothetical protein
MWNQSVLLSRDTVQYPVYPVFPRRSRHLRHKLLGRHWGPDHLLPRRFFDSYVFRLRGASLTLNQATDSVVYAAFVLGVGGPNTLFP